MTDRELLEKAAKAARIAGHYKEAEGVFSGGIFYTDELDCLRCWNPLEDDGDAQRLAVALRLEVACCDRCTIVCDGEPPDLYAREDGPDEYKNTRRAIVRAAAGARFRDI